VILRQLCVRWRERDGNKRDWYEKHAVHQKREFDIRTRKFYQSYPNNSIFEELRNLIACEPIVLILKWMHQSTLNPVRKKMLYVVFLVETFLKKSYPEELAKSQTDGTVRLRIPPAKIGLALISAKKGVMENPFR
jgi:hypothetical protein